MRAASEEELTRARVQLKAGLLMALESTNARMDALGPQLLIYGRPIPPEEMVDRIDAVGAADVARVARRIFGGRPTMAAMGPLGDADLFARLAMQTA